MCFFSYKYQTFVTLIDLLHSLVLYRPLVKLQPTVSGNSYDGEDGKSLPFMAGSCLLVLKTFKYQCNLRGLCDLYVFI